MQSLSKFSGLSLRPTLESKFCQEQNLTMCSCVCAKGLFCKQFGFQKIKHKHKTKLTQLRAEIKSNFFARNSQLISNSTRGHTQTQMIYHQIEEITYQSIYMYISHTHIRDMRSQFGFRLKFKMNIGNDMTEFSDTTKSTAEKN